VRAEQAGKRRGGEWLSGRRALVFGLARSGRAAVELLVARDAVVVGVDEGAAGRELEHGDWARRHLQGGTSAAADPALLDGVDLLVLSPGIPTTHPLVQAAGARGVPVLSEIELAYRCGTAAVVAITGSKGKSTTVALTGCLLAAQGPKCEVAGNIGRPYSAVVDLVGPGDWVVLEVSSFQLETVCDFHAHIAVLLPVSPDHLDRYPSFEAYAAAKSRIAQHQTVADVLVVDPAAAHGAALGRASVARVVGFGSTWNGTGVVVEGGELVWRAAGEREVLAAVDDVPLLGAHNLHNAMAALAVVRCVGPLGPGTRAALRAFRALPYRMQPAGEIGGIHFVNDSKGTTVDAVCAGLRGLGGTLILGLGGRNKGLDFRTLRPHLGSVRAVLAYGEAAAEIERALHGAARLLRVRDLDDMVAQALAVGRPGDIFLFSPGCTSFDMFRDAEHRGREFDAAVKRARTRADEEAAHP